MITIYITPDHQLRRRTLVDIDNETGKTKRFTFQDSGNAQTFLDNLYVLLPFLGIEYKIVDHRQ